MSSRVLVSNAPSRLQRWGRWGTLPWVAVLMRLLVGGVFVLSGFMKIMLPYAEVVALVQQYQVLPPWLVSLTAAVLPWLELGSGTALLLGLYTTPSACLIGVQLASFIGLMAIVLATGVVLEDCGCFGKLGLRETPLQVLLRDLVLLVMLAPIMWRQGEALSLDAWGQEPAPQD